MNDLRDFHLAIVVEEFQGQPPPEAVREGLHAYVAALRSSACPAAEYQDVSLERDALDLDASYEAILWAIDRRDLPTAEFALLSSKAALGRIHQRFPPDGRSQGLVEASQALTRVRSLLETRPEEALSALAQAREAQRSVLRALGAETSQSFYDPEVLRRALRSGSDREDPPRDQGGRPGPKLESTP